MYKCAICSNVFNQSDNVYGTRCNHLFHYDCLKYCLKRSETCPACYEKVLPTDIEKVEVHFDDPKIEEENSKKREVLGGEKSEGQCQYRTPNRHVSDDRIANRRMDSFAYDEPRKSNEITSINNESGTVIVCNTYDPRSINYFGWPEGGMLMPAIQLPWNWLKKMILFVFSGNDNKIVN